MTNEKNEDGFQSFAVVGNTFAFHGNRIGFQRYPRSCFDLAIAVSCVRRTYDERKGFDFLGACEGNRS